MTFDSAYGTLATTSRAGYTFTGWFTAASGGTEVTAATPVSTASNHTLYAQWDAATYTVTFNANGGNTPSPASRTVTFGSAYGTLATTSRTGYIFTGWFTAASGGTEVTAATIVSTASNHTLYAQWVADTSTVTFNANGGTGSMSNQTANIATALTANAFTRTGYTFSGWFTPASGGTQVTAATLVSTISNHTLYAQWEANTYTVTFNSNGGLEARLAAAREMVAPAGALPNPMAETVLQNIGLDDFTLGDQDMSMLSFEIRQDLPWPGKRTAARDRATARAEVEAARLELARRELVATVRVAYARLYAFDRERETLLAATELLDMLAETVAARYAASEAEQEAVIKAQLEGSRVAERLDDLLADRSRMVAGLKLLDQPGSAPLGEVTSLPPATFPEGSWEELAEVNAPEVAGAARAVQEAERGLAVARLGLKPNLSAGAGLGYRGDLDPALIEVTVDGQGNLFIADTGNSRIRKVTPDGIIQTIAGGGSPYFLYCGDGGPATAACLRWPAKVAIDQHGNLFIPDHVNNRIRKVTPEGNISTVAGTGQSSGVGTGGYAGDGGPATAAQLNGPLAVAVDAQGNLFIPDHYNHRIRLVNPQGIITTIAGTGTAGFSGDGGPATSAQINAPWAALLDPQGTLHIADAANGRIRKIAPALPGFTTQDITVPSADGAELYVFSSAGRHLRTHHALTGAIRYTFGYDPNGRVASVTDGDNNVTTIERDSAGQPTAIVAPDGQRTTLTADANGYLATLANPAGETHRFASTHDGLLQTMTTPRIQTYRFALDALGRLTRDADPAGGVKTLIVGSNRATCCFHRQIRPGVLSNSVPLVGSQCGESGFS